MNKSGDYRSSPLFSKFRAKEPPSHCRVPECENVVYVAKQTLCEKHYAKTRYHPLKVEARARKLARQCLDCQSDQVYSKNRCRNHYRMYRYRLKQEKATIADGIKPAESKKTEEKA